MTTKLFLLLCISIVFVGCKKGSDVLPGDQPAISTTAATNVTSTSAISGGVITNNNATVIISSGICWAVTQNPSILNDHTTDATITGAFTNNITGLSPASTYYVRAYIRTISDTLYGDQVSFSTPDMHIYIAGYELIGSVYVAKYWKDGNANNLTNGTQNAHATSVYAVGNDVYVAGYESNGTKNVAKVWKNGMATNLTNGTNDASATSVVVDNNIVYVAGYESNGTNTIAKLWKNGVAANLTNGTYNASANAVVVTGTNVYITGAEADGAQGSQAKVWTNGVASILDASYEAEGLSIAVSGNDVYVAGYQASSFANLWVMLWKNGHEMTIDQGNFFFGIGRSVSVDGNDVHLAGTTNDSGAAWWKNGSASALTNNYFSRANAIKVAGGTVYIVGTRRFYDVVNGNDLATLWVDNAPATLAHTGLFSYATSIFVQ